MSQTSPFPYFQHTLIRASAGSGKTYSLSSQFISLLAMGEQPQSILATTFTRKAAGEILGKVLKRLATAAISEKEAASLASDIRMPGFGSEDASRLLGLLAHELHRVSVSTLDSFFGRMAKSFRLELDLPLDPQMVAPTDPKAIRARAQAIEATFASTDSRVMVDMLKRVHHDHASRSVTMAMDRITSGLHEIYRLSPDREIWTRLSAEAADEASIESAIQDLTLYLNKHKELGKRYIAAIERNIEEARSGQWDEFIKQGIARNLIEENTTYYGSEIPGELMVIYFRLIEFALKYIVARLGRQNLATWELLHTFDQHWDEVRRASRLLSFSDLPLKLANELSLTSDEGSPGLDTIYYRMDGQVKHLLLDEFQDTSPLQWKVLRPMAQEIVNHESQGRTFFCVGDVKQSIYSWRGGCVELFDQLMNELADLRQRELNTSYRSSQVILDVVNKVFKALPESGPVKGQDEIARGMVQKLHDVFTDHQAQRDLPGFVRLITSGGQDDAPEIDFSSDSFDGGDASSDDSDGELKTSLPPDSHTQFVANYIAGLVNDHPGRTLGVLVRTNKMVSQLIHLLQKQGINASGEGGNPVTDDPAVELILSALQLADHPGDSVARHHVETSGQAHVFSLVPHEPDLLEDYSHRIRCELSIHGYAHVMNDWSNKLAAWGSPRSATRLSQLVDLAQAYELQPIARPGDFIDYVRATAVEEPMPSPIRVMTVHKAKGLEFDVVVLPELDQAMGKMGRDLSMIYREHPTADPQAIYRYANQQIVKLCPPLREAYDQEKQRSLGDDLCVLYVAMTRPRMALHMVIPPLKYNSKGTDVLSKGVDDFSPAAILRNILGNLTSEVPEVSQTLYEYGTKLWDTMPPATEKAAIQKDSFQTNQIHLNLPHTGSPSRSWRVVAPSSLETQKHVSVEELLHLQSADGRSFGSLIHAMFEQIQWLEAPLTDEQVSQIISHAGKKVPEASADQKAMAGHAFEAMLKRPGVLDALAKPRLTQPGLQVELWRERPFAVRANDALVRGVFDRVVIIRDAAGLAVSASLLDYKTDRLPDAQTADPAAGEPDEQAHAMAVQTIVTRYQAQMQAYRQALGHLLHLEPQNITAALLLLGTGQRAQVK